MTGIKLTDGRMISQLNNKLYPQVKNKNIKRSLMSKAKYIDRDTISRLLGYSVYTPLGSPCFLFVTFVNNRKITVLIKNKIYYQIFDIQIRPDTLIFGYTDDTTFFAMDILFMNGFKMLSTKYSVKSNYNNNKHAEYKHNFKERREYVKNFVNVANNVKISLQPIYSISEIGTLENDTLLFYNNFFNTLQILKWVSPDNNVINTKCSGNMITENTDHKIYNPVYKNYYTVQTDITENIPDGKICSFIVQGETTLKYIGINDSGTVSNTFDYKAAINFYTDYISYKELVSMYR
jgi:hypothetical protein